jgi:hypothetical protein
MSATSSVTDIAFVCVDAQVSGIDRLGCLGDAQSLAPVKGYLVTRTRDDIAFDISDLHGLVLSVDHQRR